MGGDIILPIQRSGQRETNSELVLRTLLREGPLSRVELAHYTGLTTAAISHITRELIDEHLLCEIGKAQTHRVGAAAILLDFPRNRPLIGVVHQAVTTLRIGLCNIRGQVLVSHLLETPDPYTPEWLITTIVRELETLLTELGASTDCLIGIGAGLSGLIHGEKGLIKRAPSFDWIDIPFRDLLTQHFTCPIVIENNVRAMGFGEALLGNGRAWSDFVFVYLGIGIGSGLILQGKPYHGAHNGAGEIGHITVEPEGKLCKCGNRGCLETISAEPAIADYAQEQGVVFSTSAHGPKDKVHELALKALDGDQVARTIITSCGESLGIALANLVDLFNPGCIVLHGTLTLAGPCFFSAVSECVHRRAFLAHDEFVQFVSPTFGNDAGLVGAAAVAIDALVLRHGARNTLKNDGRSHHDH